MNPFEIYICYISWEKGGKHRPVLSYALDSEFVRLYPITTQYDNKSEEIKARYFKIDGWAQAGLARQSYIDTGTRLKQPLSMFDDAVPVGILPDADKRRLIEFINK
jgi:hypothetical protein